jgi:hypothetical protein
MSKESAGHQVGQGNGAGAGQLEQPFGRQCPAEPRPGVVDIAVVVRCLDEQFARILPEWPRLMAIGKRQHDRARFAKGRDRAAVLIG